MLIRYAYVVIARYERVIMREMMFIAAALRATR